MVDAVSAHKPRTTKIQPNSLVCKVSYSSAGTSRDVALEMMVFCSKDIPTGWCQHVLESAMFHKSMRAVQLGLASEHASVLPKRSMIHSV